MAQSVWGLVLACGKSESIMGGADSAFLGVGSKPVIAYSMDAFERSPEIDSVAVVVSKDRMESISGLVQMFGCSKVKKIVAGTNHRNTSIAAGLKAIAGDASTVAIQSVSRPCVKPEWVTDVVKAAKRYGASAAASRLTGSYRETSKGLKSTKLVDASSFWEIQCPQAFKIDVLQEALADAAKKKVKLENEAEALALSDKEIHLVDVNGTNLKVSSADDLAHLAAMLR